MSINTDCNQDEYANDVTFVPGTQFRGKRLLRMAAREELLTTGGLEAGGAAGADLGAGIQGIQPADRHRAVHAGGEFQP